MRRSRKKKRRKIPIPVASMGDIAFLLIIFFLVCSEAAKDNSKLKIDPPISEHVKKTKVSVIARVDIDDKGQVYFDGAPVEGAKAIEGELRFMLTNTVADEQRHVQFRCDKAQPREIFEPVLQAIAAAGGIIEAVGETQK
jgi:biopolymer transport protein ExbD